jgi:hypothetical protein
MTKQELLDKAHYIQYPLLDGRYNNYDVPNLIKLPVGQSGFMYSKWVGNEGHFTMEYHRLHTIPLLCKLLNIDYKQDEFTLVEKHFGDNDISMLHPKNEYRYEIYGFERNEHFDDLSFDDIISSDATWKGITEYHKLYKYAHECSRLINKTIDTDRILFISGDSQLIPIISFLSCFFKEIWYIDNRTGIKLADKWADTKFTDVLVEFNNREKTDYTNKNFQ